MVHSWLLKSAGSIVRRSCFVDPVCFQLWVPHVVGQFLYERPKSAVMVSQKDVRADLAHLSCLETHLVLCGTRAWNGQHA